MENIIVWSIKEDKQRAEYRAKYNQKNPSSGNYADIYNERYRQHKSIKEIANIRGVSGARISQILIRIDKIIERNMMNKETI